MEAGSSWHFRPASMYRAELIQSFKLIDLDGDGIISRDEVGVALKSMSPEVPTFCLNYRSKKSLLPPI